jgi:hypothetical protein
MHPHYSIWTVLGDSQKLFRLDIETCALLLIGTFRERDNFMRNKCCRPDEKVIIRPEDNIYVIIQPGYFT